MASGVDTHTYFGGMKVISRNKACAGGRRTPGLKILCYNLYAYMYVYVAKAQLMHNIIKLNFTCMCVCVCMSTSRP